MKTTEKQQKEAQRPCCCFEARRSRAARRGGTATVQPPTGSGLVQMRGVAEESCPHLLGSLAASSSSAYSQACSLVEIFAREVLRCHFLRGHRGSPQPQTRKRHRSTSSRQAYPDDVPALYDYFKGELRRSQGRGFEHRST